MTTEEDNKRKGTTVYLTEAINNYIAMNYKSKNFGIVAALEALMVIRKYSATEIKGLFTREEWCFFADSLNGTLTAENFRCNAGALIFHSQDAEELDGTATKWDVDLQALGAKIKSLTGAQVEAIYFRVEQFWEDDSRDLEIFAQF